MTSRQHCWGEAWPEAVSAQTHTSGSFPGRAGGPSGGCCEMPGVGIEVAYPFCPRRPTFPGAPSFCPWPASVSPSGDPGLPLVPSELKHVVSPCLCVELSAACGLQGLLTFSDVILQQVGGGVQARLLSWLCWQAVPRSTLQLWGGGGRQKGMVKGRATASGTMQGRLQ